MRFIIWFRSSLSHICCLTEWYPWAAWGPACAKSVCYCSVLKSEMPWAYLSEEPFGRPSTRLQLPGKIPNDLLLSRVAQERIYRTRADMAMAYTYIANVTIMRLYLAPRSLVMTTVACNLRSTDVSFWDISPRTFSISAAYFQHAEQS
ncbi:hypothetical protein A0H81_14282 [Grifola frondosa]|uniref:Secreted protein n=1 Tax=Grifola frondosa TaxID=5627 RepID=A0A1C7LM03_GRIFR|nr:hypothetical protein A0H81_14282 [Grifola frondosa]